MPLFFGYTDACFLEGRTPSDDSNIAATSECEGPLYRRGFDRGKNA